ncbi:MAG: pseudouridine synthase, partial [Chloroflexota bacterium]
MTRLDILYHDRHIVAVHKPAGLLVHKSEIARGQDDTFAMQMVRDQVGQYVYTLHRIDRPTSGVLLFALDEPSARTLKQNFTDQLIEKAYLAIVRGWPPKKMTIDYPLKPADYGKKFRRKKTKRSPKESKPAVTHFEQLGRVMVQSAVGRYETARYALLHITPKTGRTHQIRRHLAHLRHPIVGDKRYGDRHHNRFFTEILGLSGLFLLARSIS